MGTHFARSTRQRSHRNLRPLTGSTQQQLTCRAHPKAAAEDTMGGGGPDKSSSSKHDTAKAIKHGDIRQDRHSSMDGMGAHNLGSEIDAQLNPAVDAKDEAGEELKAP